MGTEEVGRGCIVYERGWRYKDEEREGRRESERTSAGFTVKPPSYSVIEKAIEEVTFQETLFRYFSLLLQILQILIG